MHALPANQPAAFAATVNPKSTFRPALAERPAFGTGFGRSSGYVHRPSYVRDWAPVRFSLR